MKKMSDDKVNWKHELLQRLKRTCKDAAFAHEFAGKEATAGIHLAVFVEPYLTYVLEGKKTVESRFGATRQPPFQQVAVGDIIVLKKTGGPVCGLCRVANVWCYRLDADTWSEIERFSGALCMDGSDFWKSKRAASFATLMQVESVRSVEEFQIGKEDPRGWVVLRRAARGNQQPLPWHAS